MSRLDTDLKKMSPAALRREIRRLRKGLRSWDRQGNARCHHNDAQLVLLLPERRRPGRMGEPLVSHFRKCIRYARRMRGRLPCTEAEWLLRCVDYLRGQKCRGEACGGCRPKAGAR